MHGQKVNENQSKHACGGLRSPIIVIARIPTTQWLLGYHRPALQLGYVRSFGQTLFQARLRTTLVQDELGPIGLRYTRWTKPMSSKSTV